MTTNKQIEEQIIKEFDETIYCKGKQCRWCKGLGTCGSGINPDNAKKFIKAAIKQTQKDTLDKVRQIIGEDEDTKTFGGGQTHQKVTRNLFRDELRLKLNQLENEQSN